MQYVIYTNQSFVFSANYSVEAVYIKFACCVPHLTLKEFLSVIKFAEFLLCYNFIILHIGMYLKFGTQIVAVCTLFVHKCLLA